MPKWKKSRSGSMFVASCDGSSSLNVSSVAVCHAPQHGSTNTNNNYPGSGIATTVLLATPSTVPVTSSAYNNNHHPHNSHHPSHSPHNHQQQYYYSATTTSNNQAHHSQFSPSNFRRGGGGGGGYHGRGGNHRRGGNSYHYRGARGGGGTYGQHYPYSHNTSNNHNYQPQVFNVSQNTQPLMAASISSSTVPNVTMLDPQSWAAAMIQAMQVMASTSAGVKGGTNPNLFPSTCSTPASLSSATPMNLLSGSTNHPAVFSQIMQHLLSTNYAQLPPQVAQALTNFLSNPQAMNALLTNKTVTTLPEAWQNALLTAFTNFKATAGQANTNSTAMLNNAPSSTAMNSFGLETIKLQNEGLQREHSYQQLRAVSGSAASALTNERDSKDGSSTAVQSSDSRMSNEPDVTECERNATTQASHSQNTSPMSHGKQMDSSSALGEQNRLLFTLSSDDSSSGEDSVVHVDSEQEEEPSVSLSVNMPRGSSAESEEEIRQSEPILPEVIGRSSSSQVVQDNDTLCSNQIFMSSTLMSIMGSYEDQVSEKVWQFYLENRQTDDTYHRKIQLRNALHIVMSYVFQDAGLFVVGSSMNGFGNDNSDMDLCLTLTAAELSQKKEAQVVLHELVEPLQKCSFIQRLQLIRAKVPILKFHDSHARVDCDLNINNVVGIYNTHLLAMYTRVDWRVRPLGMFVKHWAVQMEIHDASRGRISTYTLILMLIHYLQSGCKPAVLPSLQAIFPNHFSYERAPKEVDMRLVLPWDELQSHNTASLYELFHGFLEYYAERFDFSKWAVSVRTGKAIPIDAAIKQLPPHEQLQAATSFKIFVQEPFNLNNTARALFDDDIFRRVQRVFSSTLQLLRRQGDLSHHLYHHSS